MLRVKINHRGFALVVVIIVMLLASFLASELIMLVRTELKISHNHHKRAVEHFLAAAGINLCIFRLVDVPLDAEEDEDLQFIHGQVYEEYLPTGKIRYYAINESGKIDLNWQQPGLLRLFLEYHKLEEIQIETIMDSLEDWRDTDDLHRINGAEQEIYEELDPPYIAKNGPIEDPAEFFLVYGAEILADAFDPQDVFTVYNAAGNGKINFNSLSPTMLDFVTEGDQEKKEAYFDGLQESKGQLQGLAQQILGEERFADLSPYLTFSSGKNVYYTLVSESYGGITPDKDAELQAEENSPPPSGSKISALVELKGSAYTILSWVEGFV